MTDTSKQDSCAYFILIRGAQRKRKRKKKGEKRRGKTEKNIETRGGIFAKYVPHGQVQKAPGRLKGRMKAGKGN